VTLASVYVRDDQLVPEMMADVVVSLVDPEDSALITRTTTDVGGEAAFDVPDGTYEVRVFKDGYSSVVSQIVISALETSNEFDITIESLRVLAPATDARMCRCTGIFVNYEGRPLKGVAFRVMADLETGLQIPKVVDGKLVVSDGMAFQTDENGKIVVDLYRGGHYHAVFAGEDDTTWSFTVPNRSSVNLVELLFPTPVLVTWDQTVAPDNEIEVLVGETVAVPVSLLLSSYITKTKKLSPWVKFLNADGTIADLSFDDAIGVAYLKGVLPGTTQVTVVLQDNLLPFRIPLPSLTAAPLQVVVTL
jgi:hypothetical protein